MTLKHISLQLGDPSERLIDIDEDFGVHVLHDQAYPKYVHVTYAQGPAKMAVRLASLGAELTNDWKFIGHAVHHGHYSFALLRPVAAELAAAPTMEPIVAKPPMSMPDAVFGIKPKQA